MAERGGRLHCTTCGGVMVSAQEITDLLRNMDPDEIRPLEEQLRPCEPGIRRRCPRCAAEMEGGLLRGVPLDRCPSHGLWFDGKELAATLESAGNAFAEAEWERAPKSHGRIGFNVSFGVGGFGGSTDMDTFFRRLFSPKRPKDL